VRHFIQTTNRHQ
jgi:hypothetical protein